MIGGVVRAEDVGDSLASEGEGIDDEVVVEKLLGCGTELGVLRWGGDIYIYIYKRERREKYREG